MSRSVKFSKKVTSKTTVTTCPTTPGKSILKKPQQYRVGPDGRYLSGPQKGWKAKKLTDIVPQPKPTDECDPSQPAGTVRPRFVPPRPPYTPEELKHREWHRKDTRKMHKLRLPSSGGRGLPRRIGRHEVLPVIGEDTELDEWNLPRDRGQCHYKYPQRPQKPPQEWLDTNFFIDDGGPTDFSKYHRILENYSPQPQAGDSGYCAPPAPRSSPEPIPDLIDWGCEDVGGDEDIPYGPTHPMEELACDPQFYAAAGSMIEGGLMDFMPQVDLPAPMMPTQYQPPGYGPSGGGFATPLSTRRHKMVEWCDQPQVRLYRPDLPPISPYSPYTPQELGYQGLEDDMIGLYSPPQPPSEAELSRLRYTPPPASPPDRPYTGMFEGDWGRIEGMPMPGPRQYSPTGLPRHYGEPCPPAYSPPAYSPYGAPRTPSPAHRLNSSMVRHTSLPDHRLR
uniref:Uncharacterized protein n=1 Tax=Lygus hesperus TaxID=30085 RepID=A0A0A9YU66_LYGHE